MKRFLGYIFITFLFVFVGVGSAKAASLSLSASQVKVSGSFTISYDTADNNNENKYTLNYDSGYFIISSGDINGTTLTKTKGSVSFNVKSSLSLTANKELSFLLKNGDNTEVASTKITVLSNKTAPVETPKSSTPTTAAKSNNANLKTLAVKDQDGAVINYTPEFKADVYEYTVDAPSTTTKVSIDATLEDEKANAIISDNANDELKAGETTKVTITVTAEDGTKKAYVVNIKRQALNADATLKTLKIKEYSNFKLKKNVFKYTIKIKDNIKELTLNYKANNEDATVKVTGNKNLKDGSKVKILVTAADGTKKEYILTVSKIVSKNNTKSNIEAVKDPLIIMLLSMIGFALIGGIVYISKK